MGRTNVWQYFSKKNSWHRPFCLSDIIYRDLQYQRKKHVCSLEYWKETMNRFDISHVLTTSYKGFATFAFDTFQQIVCHIIHMKCTKRIVYFKEKKRANKLMTCTWDRSNMRPAGAVNLCFVQAVHPSNHVDGEQASSLHWSRDQSCGLQGLRHSWYIETFSFTVYCT